MSAESLESIPELGNAVVEPHIAPPPSHMAPAERVEALTQGLVDLLDQAVNEPWRWQKLLDNSATLWRYSGGNAAMLMAQMQERGKEPPTLVAGYKEWQRHGRYVLKGEHALWVIAPMTARADSNEEGEVAMKQTFNAPDDLAGHSRTRIVGWRGQSVFDVSQTEGEPLLVPRDNAEPTAEANIAHDALWASLVDIASGRGFAVDLSDSQHSLASGYTNFTSHQISIGEWLDADDRLAVLAHELGHVMLHGPDDALGQLYGSSAEHRGLAEVEAESVAYTVLNAHGIDRGPQSSSYLAGWADAVIAAEADSIVSPTAGCKLLSRTDIAKSVLARVATTCRNILDHLDDSAVGGRLPALTTNFLIRNGEKYVSPVRSLEWTFQHRPALG
ncbi:ArdC-like ssDNA-binding domain-containing protein [Arthrobacter antibioticus]|uniref:ArdC-like ssDNA-binding domain-containing protein n=1 Tax=Arthrobacter sp. H35-MC1 TaxID=3046203 RepID=UPI0024B87CD4|nr:ArdC-like ssDNA-binding domain-containing protein [Arthrobacter sp. H35-MC1]MDJ0318392.1 ArdC-like ssDNA-binding domain-containing protein [Arthrobacter sp. H35-MC1]